MGTKKSDFKKGTLRPSSKVVKTYNGRLKANLQEGELDWTAFTDAGIAVPLALQRSLLVPHAEGRIFSPQHWAQSHTKNRQQRTERGEHTNGNECVLYWENGNYKRHVDLGRTDNVATITLTPGYKQFEAFSSEAELDDPMGDPIALPSGIISDDDDDPATVPATSQPT